MNTNYFLIPLNCAFRVKQHWRSTHTFHGTTEVKLSGVGETVVIIVHDQSFPSPNLKQQTVHFFLSDVSLANLRNMEVMLFTLCL